MGANTIFSSTYYLRHLHHINSITTQLLLEISQDYPTKPNKHLLLIHHPTTPLHTSPNNNPTKVSCCVPLLLGCWPSSKINQGWQQKNQNREHRGEVAEDSRPQFGHAAATQGGRSWGETASAWSLADDSKRHREDGISLLQLGIQETGKQMARGRRVANYSCCCCRCTAIAAVAAAVSSSSSCF